MRTLGGEVVGGCWGRPPFGGSLLEAFPVACVAVLPGCILSGLIALPARRGIKRHLHAPSLAEGSAG
jgi:hypothetical protein